MPSTTGNNRSRSDRATATRDAIAVLKDDHKTLRGLLEDLNSARDSRKKEKLLDQIKAEIFVHSRIEEEIFYPAYLEATRKKEDRKLFFEAAEEHHVVDLVLPEIEAEDPASEEFAAKAMVLQELIQHHAGEEEKEMFPRARKLMSKALLLDLGAELVARKKSLKTEM